jgi:hypothetical protein
MLGGSCPFAIIDNAILHYQQWGSLSYLAKGKLPTVNHGISIV